MALVTNPTYLLAPNWNYQLDGPIALGSIVADPFKPHRPLSKPTTDAPIPKTEHSVEHNWKTETEKLRDVNVSLWAQVLNIANLNIGARRSKTTTITFEMSQLDTVYFGEDPSSENIALRARDARVKTALKIGNRFLRGTVYMVSGLKIARGFKLTQSNATERGGQIGAGGMVTPEVSVGGNLDVTTGMSRTTGSEAGHDIIFAYQLLRITTKGKGEKLTFELDEFQDDAAFLHDNDINDDEDAGPEVEITAVPPAELAETQRGMTVKPDDDQYAWLFCS
ncbi:hypothetical protein CkaCkLH20_12300 [Colletotrichum karsti]|uniref:Uncharacterized protein n=1 Tax=Colletotrichum karsti TaxID=1095194 RepID=A0A9P6HTZ2_9PEZI|nr:uncharacterized protein CkaCkLH20_12300 [Colletotrichum karsti]KAF9870214.1 hypothetical protein CkaCkLH20_12300 [Colletotrichum karsti]